MLIGELSETVGLPVDTIRFYEKRGLLTEKHFCRKDNNYRDYTETAVARLELIKQGQLVGLTLAEMAHFIEAWETDALTTAQKIAFFEGKIVQVDAKIAQLERTKTYIRSKIRMIKGMEKVAKPVGEPDR
jgi:DNA-binding transcriptional MerR regulator